MTRAAAIASHLVGATAAGDVVSVEFDQYHANCIEVDDTSAVRIMTARGLPVSLGLTLCASTQTLPRIVVQGRTGQAVFNDDTDTAQVTGAGRGAHSRRAANRPADLPPGPSRRPVRSAAVLAERHRCV